MHPIQLNPASFIILRTKTNLLLHKIMGSFQIAESNTSCSVTQKKTLMINFGIISHWLHPPKNWLDPYIFLAFSLLHGKIIWMMEKLSEINPLLFRN